MTLSFAEEMVMSLHETTKYGPQGRITPSKAR